MLRSKAALAKLGSLRTYASASSVAPTVLSTANGIKVAAVEGHADSPLASISLVINHGSRFETAATSGAAHYLKAFGFRNTQERTSFRTVREAELNGATLTASATRENITYTVQCFRDAVPYFVDILGDIAAATKFSEHEFRDIAKLVRFEALAARENPQARVIDGVHQAAFRSGLGNSLYALESSPVHTGDAVREYAQAAMQSGRVAVVGTGVDAVTLAALVGESKLAALAGSAGAGAKAKFTGGGHQIYDSAAPVSHYALAFESDPSSAAALASLLGAQRRLKWGAGGASPLAKLAFTEGFAAESFSFAYSDAALVGVLVSAPSAHISAAVEKVAGVIQASVAKASPEAVARAVAATRLDVAEAQATQLGVISELSKLALGQGPSASLEAVDAVAASLAQTAAKVFSAKPVAASIGLSQTTAYVDTLGF
ncbi:ubiquinol-cytochrome c reductase core subunit 1 [Coemansia sp. RSA 2337]|nr:ubiquinol-cytochrome c reductase core subunit 1 [Coemansia sp. S680]KAJ2033491.1 ubiquinol-cytochrome c reductase core subunit 1 [Coemansia sp. S3946]KAJ2046518.1 ubiquinol-cytochrome c reductase core subunit 1 [Coemansia sp. S16]KAJ2072310.1 ubiquinol-cytochrome c reductase core subunit 1 [Coemansia sp. S155-1]KAJ2113090.1 ubiquinol-cytochrome c reductase core subunit 1 [Coemansia sp. RSA 922]KAJ2351452.1 ubiquinol-cytochrome c reductase core subunit 1 [Coemansia sp. RSA 2673]KAJ2423502.1